jgi:hypothetical protein
MVITDKADDRDEELVTTSGGGGEARQEGVNTKAMLEK